MGLICIEKGMSLGAVSRVLVVGLHMFFPGKLYIDSFVSTSTKRCLHSGNAALLLLDELLLSSLLFLICARII